MEQVEDLPINAVGVYLQESEEFGNRIFDRNYNALWDTFERQGVVHETLAVAAPLLAVRTLSMGLAGTDVEQHRHFATAAETYRRDLMRRMNGDMAENSRTGDFSYAADAELWESVPSAAIRRSNAGLGARATASCRCWFWGPGWPGRSWWLRRASGARR